MIVLEGTTVENYPLKRWKTPFSFLFQPKWIPKCFYMIKRKYEKNFPLGNHETLALSYLNFVLLSCFCYFLLFSRHSWVVYCLSLFECFVLVKKKFFFSRFFFFHELRLWCKPVIHETA